MIDRNQTSIFPNFKNLFFDYVCMIRAPRSSHHDMISDNVECKRSFWLDESTNFTLLFLLSKTSSSSTVTVTLLCWGTLIHTLTSGKEAA